MFLLKKCKAFNFGSICSMVSIKYEYELTMNRQIPVQNDLENITNTMVAAELRHGTAVSNKLSHLAIVLVLHPFSVTVTHDCAWTLGTMNIWAKINVATVSQRLVLMDCSYQYALSQNQRNLATIHILNSNLHHEYFDFMMQPTWNWICLTEAVKNEMSVHKNYFFLHDVNSMLF